MAIFVTRAGELTAIVWIGNGRKNDGGNGSRANAEVAEQHPFAGDGHVDPYETQDEYREERDAERHWLQGTEERYVILAGEGFLEVGNEPALRVSALDTVLIPAGMAQRIMNTGPETLTFLCVCPPRFEPSCYQDGKPADAPG